MFRHIVHIHFSELLHENRALKATRAALDKGLADKVTWIGYTLGAEETRTSLFPGMEIIGLPLRKLPGVPGALARMLQLKLWGRAARHRAAALNPDLLHIHSLACLTETASLKKTLGVPLLFDAHELETERHGWSPLRRAFAKIAERRVIGVPDAMMVVTDSIADWYRDTYRMPRPVVVRNAPERPAQKPLPNDLMRRNLGIPDGELIFVYVGVINHGRGFEEIIDAFATLPKDRHAVFLGFGPAVDAIKAAHDRLGNVHWHPAVPNLEVPLYLAGADVGLLTIEPTALSYRFSLGNKFLQCRAAHIPVISTDLVEHRSYLEAHGGGWILPALTGPAIAAMISGLSKAAIAAKKAEIRDDGIFWDMEEPKFLAVLAEIVQKS